MCKHKTLQPFVYTQDRTVFGTHNLQFRSNAMQFRLWYQVLVDRVGACLHTAILPRTVAIANFKFNFFGKKEMKEFDQNIDSSSEEDPVPDFDVGDVNKHFKMCEPSYEIHVGKPREYILHLDFNRQK